MSGDGCWSCAYFAVRDFLRRRALRKWHDVVICNGALICYTDATGTYYPSPCQCSRQEEHLIIFHRR